MNDTILYKHLSPGIVLIVIALSGLFSFFLTRLIIKFAHRKKLVASPNERSLHAVPTPKVGGLAIVVSWYLGITVFYYGGLIERQLFLALLSGSLLAVVSLIDDLIELRPFIRLIIQFITSILAFYFLQGLRPLIIPQIEFNYNYFIYPLAIVGMVWYINLFNFMDGVDGFASTEAIIMSLVLFVFSGDMITLLLIACVAGFLYWNWPKAKIFMGDVCSTQLGFILVVLGIYYHNSYKFSILNWIMLASPFWFDATLTLLRRWRNGEKLSQAHRKHAYQRIVQAGFSHMRVNIFLIMINLINILVILLYREVKILQIPLFVLTMIFYYYLTRLVDKKIPFTRTHI